MLATALEGLHQVRRDMPTLGTLKERFQGSSKRTCLSSACPLSRATLALLRATSRPCMPLRSRHTTKPGSTLKGAFLYLQAEAALLPCLRLRLHPVVQHGVKDRHRRTSATASTDRFSETHRVICLRRVLQKAASTCGCQQVLAVTS
jgi:hypothetical protein